MELIEQSPSEQQFQESAASIVKMTRTGQDEHLMNRSLVRNAAAPEKIVFPIYYGEKPLPDPLANLDEQRDAP